MSSTYLHRMAGVRARLCREALAGTCAMAGCGRPASGFIDSPTHGPRGICDDHTATAIRFGYAVHTMEDLT